MEPLTPSPEPVIGEQQWIQVDESSSAASARRYAVGLGRSLGLAEQRLAELGIVAAEMTTNLDKHATDGLILVRSLVASDRHGVELIAVDSGPGMPDVIASGRDGHSTVGTLGIGLGAIARQSMWWETYSLPGKGTVLAAQVWTEAPAPEAWGAGLYRPIAGETACGDGFALRTLPESGRRQAMVCDGLGHGPLAAATTEVAVRAFLAAPPGSPAAVVEHLHRSLNGTRGAAILVAEFDPAGGKVVCAGLGNVAGAVVTHDGRKPVLSTPGIAGHQRRTIRELPYDFPAEARFVMHSDGVTERWSLRDYPALLGRSPIVLAATLLRDSSVRRDDACVLVIRP